MQFKRCLITLYDIASTIIVAWLFSFALVTPAWAYIDPSVMTYTIQAVAGVAVALSAVAGVALRRGRKVLYKLVDVDEDAKKQFEPDVSRTTEAPVAHVSVHCADEVSADGHSPIAQDDADTQEGVASHEDAARQVAVSQEDAAERNDASLPIAGAVDVAGEAGVPGHAEVDKPANFAEVPESKEAVESVEPQEPAKSQGTQESAKSQESAKPKKPKNRFLQGDPNPFRPKWKQRILYALVATAFTIFTVFVFAPLEVVGGSVGSLVFSVGDIWWVLIPPALGIVAAWSLLISALRGRAFGFAVLLTFGVGLAAYIQSLVLNVGLPLANGDTIVWSDYMGMHVISALVWIVVIVGVLTYGHFRNKRAQGIAAIAAAFLFIVQFVGAASLFVSPTEVTEVTGGGGDALNTDLMHRTEVVMTEDQLYTVNPNHNVIVFVLDTYDNAYLNSALRSRHDVTQDVLDEFTGFTYFKNATSAMIPTRFAIPFMMTGEMPTPDEPFSVYKANRYARSTFLQEIADLDYSIGLYSDSLTIGALPQEEQNRITDLTVNMHKLSSETVDFGGALYALYQMGLYRDAPWPFKWAFWYYTDSINAMIVKYDPEALPEETIYVIDDIRYYNRLEKYGLTLEEGDYEGGFRFIHLLGSHYPFNYDEYVNDLGVDGSSVIPQSIGALRIVATYIQDLKDLGVYEDTTIIVTADHGYWTITLDPIEETSTPIMFVKPAQSAALDELPMIDDMTPVSHLDLQATILEAMGADPGEWKAYGYSMLSPDEIPSDRVRLYLTTDSEPDLTDVRLREYAIDGDAQDWSTWSETGRIWSTQE